MKLRSKKLTFANAGGLSGNLCPSVKMSAVFSLESHGGVGVAQKMAANEC